MSGLDNAWHRVYTHGSFKSKLKGDGMNQELRVKLTKDIERLSNEIVTDPDKLKDFAAKWTNGFHDYSFGNLLLIMFQKPEATLCAGFRQWNKYNRYVKRGEHGIAILAPWFGKKEVKQDNGEVEEESVVRFFPVHVFDLSQTDGEEIELGHSEKVSQTEYKVVDIAKLFNYTLRISQDTIENGKTDGKTITVSHRPNESSMLATYFHELAHCELGHIGDNGSRPTRELEAEAVSFLVCSVLGFDHDRARYYIGHWEGDSAKLANCGTRILKCAEKIARKVLDSYTLTLQGFGPGSQRTS